MTYVFSFKAKPLKTSIVLSQPDGDWHRLSPQRRGVDLPRCKPVRQTDPFQFVAVVGRTSEGLHQQPGKRARILSTNISL